MFIRKQRFAWLLLALAGMLVPSVPCRGQGIEPANPDSIPASSRAPAAYVLPPVGQVPQIAAIVNPVIDDSPTGPPGYFTNFEMLFLHPHLNSNLVGHVTAVPGKVDTVNLYTTGLLGNVFSPIFQVGYRLPEQQGEFSLKYQFEIAARNSVPSDIIGGIGQRDRLNMHIIDLDWSNRFPYGVQAPGWELRYNVGPSLGIIDYDTTRNFGGPAVTPTGIFTQKAANSFIGGGPEFGGLLTRELFTPGLKLLGRFQGSCLFGNIYQSFSETVAGPGGAVFSGYEISHYQVAVNHLRLQMGLSYTPPGWNQSKVEFGYLWEEFWQIGRLNNSNGDLLNRGLFLRAEWNF